MPRTLEYSVVICTRDRAETTAACLRALIADIAPLEEPGEVIVIDNASTDQTRQAVMEAFDRECGNAVLRYAFEALPGLARSRNRGLEEASGAIVAFLDDDAMVRPGWLRSCLDAFAAWPDAAAVGGEILPRSRAPFPDWFRPPLTKVYSVMSLDGKLDGGPGDPGWLREGTSAGASGVRPYPDEEHPLGASMAFRREALAGHRFSLQLGRTGSDLMGSEEAEILFALKREGRAVLYVPDMRVDHEIAAERLSPDWAVRRYWFDGASRARLRLGRRQWARDAALMAAKLAWLAATRPLPRTEFGRLLWRCRLAKCLGFLAESKRRATLLASRTRSGPAPHPATASFAKGDATPPAPP